MEQPTLHQKVAHYSVIRTC